MRVASWGSEAGEGSLVLAGPVSLVAYGVSQESAADRVGEETHEVSLEHGDLLRGELLSAPLLFRTRLALAQLCTRRLEVHLDGLDAGLQFADDVVSMMDCEF